MNGAQLIATERRRQIKVEGWTARHDDGHAYGELALAAQCYAESELRKGGDPERAWPWNLEWWKPSNDPIRNLVKAGALIAAEIDRLQRMKRRKRE